MRILICPETPTSATVLDCLTSWSGSGLLRPFCWWVTPPGAGSVGLQVVRVDGGEQYEEPLATALGDVEPQDVRVLGLFAATPAEGFDPGFSDDLQARLDRAGVVLAPAEGQPLEAAMVVVPVEVAQPVPPELFHPFRSANVYVAPEDRAHPDAANELPDNTARLGPHAAHAIATIADLWVTRHADEQSVLDRLVDVQVGHETVPVRVVRCYSRMVDFGYFSGHLAAQVFTPGKAWPNPDITKFDRISSGGDRLDFLVRNYLDVHRQVLDVSEVEKIPLPEPEVLSIWEAIKRLFREVLFRVREMPVIYVREKVIAAHDHVAGRLNRLVPKGSNWKVKTLADQEASTSDLRDLREQLDRPIVQPNGPVKDTWTDLRMMTLGMIDGTELPRSLDSSVLQSEDKRAVISDPERIVPDPRDRPPAEPGEDGMPRACDPLRLDPELAARWRAVRSDGVEEVVPASEVVDEPQAEPEMADTSWKDRYGSTPTWKVGEAIARSWIRALQEGKDPADDPEERERIEQAEEVERQRSLTAARADRRRAWMTFVGASAGAVVAAVAAVLIFVWWLLPPAFLAIGACWLAVMVGLARSVVGRREQAELDILAREIDKLNVAMERAYRRGDAIRLQRRYEEFLDWSEIIGFMAHHPWVGEPLSRVTVQSDIDPDTLPAAMGLAIADTGPRLEQVGNEARRILFHPQWLTGLYSSMEAQVQDLIREQNGLGPDAPVPPAAADVLEDVDSPRRVLLRRTRRGDGRRLRENPMSEELLRFIDGFPIDGAAEGAAVLDGDARAASPLPPAATWFTPPEELADLADTLRGTVVRITTSAEGVEAGGSGVVVTDDGHIATARHVIDDASDITVTFADGTAVAAVVDRVSTTTDLAVLSVVDSHVDVAARFGADTGVRQGDPVITLGHPQLQDGEASLAWGLVTATDRTIEVDGVGRLRVLQATYSSAGGASGAPVFDLEGRLVGIHAASAELGGGNVPSYLSSAVPASELTALMSGATESSELLAVRDAAAAADPSVRRPTPSAFLDRLNDEPAALSLLHQHFADLKDRPERFDDVLRPRLARVAGVRFAPVAGAAGFLIPSRVVTHRVELAAPVPPEGLQSCADG